MSVVIFSPHTDDAIFSMGGYLKAMANTTIITPLAGVPGNDIQGRDKHTLLNHEHSKACGRLNVNFINGPFLDDVYPTEFTRYELLNWMMGHVRPNDEVFIPLGIYHPDHVMVSNILITQINTINFPSRDTYFYEEKPYRNDHWNPAAERRDYIKNHVGSLKKAELGACDVEAKRDAVKLYASQVKNDATDHIIERVMGGPDVVWKLSR